MVLVTAAMSKRKKRILNAVLLFLGSVLLTALFTWPFAAKLFTFYPDYGRFGDYTFSGAMLWYNQEAIRTGKIFNQQEYFNGFMFYPQPYTVAYTDHSFFPSLLFGIIFSITKDQVASTNITTFAVLLLNFLSGFLALSFFLKHRLASIVGAIIFTFNPIVFAHFPQHFGLLNRYFLPPVFLFAYLFFKTPGVRNAFLFFLFFTLNALSVVYYFVFATLLVPLIAVPLLINNLKKKNVAYFSILLKCSLISLVFLPLFWYFYSPYLAFSSKENLRRSVEESIVNSARPLDWLTSTPYSLLYGGFVKSLDGARGFHNDVVTFLNTNSKVDLSFLRYEEHTLSLNILPLALFVVGIVALRKKIYSFASCFLLLLVATFLLAFGPTGLMEYPYRVLHDLFLFMQAIRVPTRFELLFYLPFSVFASIGALTLFQSERLKRYRMAIFVCIMFLLFLENYNLNQFNDTSFMLGKFQKLNRHGDLSFLRDKKTVHFPIFVPDLPRETMYLNWAITSGETIVNGNNAYLPSDQLDFLIQLKQKGLQPQTIERLLALGVEYVVIHRDLLREEGIIDVDTATKDPTSVIFHSDDTVILELKNQDFPLKICTFPDDFVIEIFKTGAPNYPTQFYVVSITNQSMCLLPSIYENRYRTIDFIENSRKRTAKMRLPILIEPKQKVTLSEPEGTLSIN